MKKSRYSVFVGDCVDLMRKCPAHSVDAIATDPPYGLKFMGKAFDDLGEGAQQREWHKAWAKEALRVLKPGGYIIAFGGTRTYHHLASALEEVGFEIRDCISWVHGQGFPKSLNISKAIDKVRGAERTEVIGQGRAGAAFHYGNPGEGGFGNTQDKKGGTASSSWDVLAPATPEAQTWDGWGTALKPSVEPAVLARKPCSEPTVAANVLSFGTGALNVDGCRVGTNSDVSAVHATRRSDYPQSYVGNGAGWGRTRGGYAGDEVHWEPKGGRWPANLIHDGSDEVLALFPSTKSGTMRGEQQGWGKRGIYGEGGLTPATSYADAGSAARFFYCAKANKQERGEGNNHPTVKPVALMEYLIKLVLPPGGIVLDPFAGSGTTLVAAKNLGVRAIGMELDPEYAAIATRRIKGTK